MGNTFTHFLGDNELNVNTTSDMYAFALINLTNPITFTPTNAWTFEESSGGTPYTYIFKYKPNGTETAATLDRVNVGTINSGTIPDESTVHWVNDTSFTGNLSNKSTPWSDDGFYNVEYSSVNQGTAGGDPHILPLIGEKYDLGSKPATYILFDNMDENEKVMILGRTGLLPKQFIQKVLHKFKKTNIDKYYEYQKRYKSQYYFDKIRICLNEVYLDIDMMSLDIVDSNLDNPHYVKSVEKIIFDEIKKTHNGMDSLQSKNGGKKGLAIYEKTINIVTSNDTISVRLCYSHKKLTEFNTIGIRFNGSSSYYRGAMVRQDIREVDMI